MENWLHFGIDNKAIKEQYNQMLTFTFPQPPEEDSLYDLYSELVELDGYIMGVVSTYLKKGKITSCNLACDEEFLKIYAKISIQSDELEAILQYKQELDKLVVLLKSGSK